LDIGRMDEGVHQRTSGLDWNVPLVSGRGLAPGGNSACGT
jgi:hypothetical protein